MKISADAQIVNDTVSAATGTLSSCANCDAQLAVGQRYCGTCGQRTGRARLTMRDIGHDFLHALTHVDHSILSLVKALLLRPGFVAREYVEGRRKKYFGPFAFLVIAVGLASFLIVVSGVKWVEANGQTGIVEFLQRHVNVVMLLQIPPLATACWLLFWNERLYFAEHLVLVAYVSGFKILCLALIALPIVMLTKTGFANFSFASIYPSLSTLYFAFAATQFYRGGRAWVIVRAVIVAVIGQVLAYALLSLLLTAYIRLTQP